MYTYRLYFYINSRIGEEEIIKEGGKEEEEGEEESKYNTLPTRRLLTS